MSKSSLQERTPDRVSELHPLEGILDRILQAAQKISPDRPEDLAQAALLKLLAAEARGTLPPFESNHQLFGYARETMRNLAASSHRHWSSRAEPLLDAGAKLPSDDVPIAGRPNPAEVALPIRARLAVVLRSRLGCSHEVIAGLLGHPTKEASQCFHSRSLRALRRGLERA